MYKITLIKWYGIPETYNKRDKTLLKKAVKM